VKLSISICSLHRVKTLCHRFGNALEKTEKPWSNVLSTYYDYYYVCHFSKLRVVFMHRTHRGLESTTCFCSALRAAGAHSHRMRVPHSCPHSAHEKCNYFQFRSDHAECITAVTCRHFAMHISASLMCPIFASLRRQRLVRNDEMGKITGDSQVAHSAAAPAN
jgi:hypothetical protein